jgi:hypothetical protein
VLSHAARSISLGRRCGVERAAPPGRP